MSCCSSLFSAKDDKASFEISTLEKTTEECCVFILCECEGRLVVDGIR